MLLGLQDVGLTGLGFSRCLWQAKLALRPEPTPLDRRGPARRLGVSCGWSLRSGSRVLGFWLVRVWLRIVSVDGRRFQPYSDY